MTDPVEFGLYKNKFSFRYVKPEHIPAALEHARKYLFESLTCLGYQESMVEDWMDMFKAILESTVGTSFLAFDTETNNIAGIRVIPLVTKNDPKHPEMSFKFQENKRIFDYLMSLASKCEIFEMYPEVDQFADLFGISVDPLYRQQGLATEMYKRCFAMLKQRGIRIARCGFSSPFSRKAAYNLGCIRIVKEMVKDAKGLDGSWLNPNADPEEFIDYGVFEL